MSEAPEPAPLAPPPRDQRDQPDADQLRRQARELHRAYRDGEPHAVAEVDAHYPDADPDALQLGHAQLALARAHGFENWPALMLEVERRQPDARAFRGAVERGDVDALRSALGTHPALVEKIDRPWFSFGATALLYAVGRGDRAMVDALLDAGADIDARSLWANGPFGVLHSAEPDLARHLVGRGATPDACGAANMGDLDALRRIVDADPSRVHERGGDGKQPLHFARTVAVAEYLLDRGADINARCVDHHSTPLMYLAVDQPEVARRLLGRGATPDVFAAIALDDTALLRRLLDEEPRRVNWRMNEGEYDPPEGIYLMYTWTLKLGYGEHHPAPLHAAAVLDRVEAARELLDRGADLNTRGAYDDSTPLHIAAYHGSPGVGRLLIERGADLERRSGPNHRNTPLGWAIVGGSVDMAALLLDAGAELLDHCLPDARAGKAGRFDFSPGTPDDFARIEQLIIETAAQRGLALDPDSGKATGDTT